MFNRKDDMSNQTVSMIRELTKEAEERIFGILQELQQMTELSIDDLELQMNWFNNRDEDGELNLEKEAKTWSEITGVKIRLNFDA